MQHDISTAAGRRANSEARMNARLGIATARINVVFRSKLTAIKADEQLTALIGMDADRTTLRMKARGATGAYVIEGDVTELSEMLTRVCRTVDDNRWLAGELNEMRGNVVDERGIRAFMTWVR